MAEDQRPRTRKRLFLGLAVLSLLTASAGTYAVWAISAPGLAHIHPWLPLALGLALVVVIAALALGIAGVILAILGAPLLLRVAQALAWWAINLLFPMINLLGGLLGIDRPRIERSFLEVSNYLVRQRKPRVPPDRLLILAPHCLQRDVCPHKITRKVQNCRCCGLCQVGSLLKLARPLGVHVIVVPGGTLARQMIKSLRPKAVVAIACERDLVTGIQDVFPLPVIGILNERPQGPCCNTRVELERIAAAVEELTGLSFDLPESAAPSAAHNDSVTASPTTPTASLLTKADPRSPKYALLQQLPKGLRAPRSRKDH